MASTKAVAIPAEGADLQLLSTTQVQKITGFGKPRIKQHIDAGELFAVETSPRGAQRRRVKVPLWALREFMAKRAVVPVPNEKPGRKRRATKGRY